MSVSGTPAQQEAALKKLEGERDRLVAEVLTLQEALSTRQACEECVARRAPRNACSPQRTGPHRSVIVYCAP